MLPRTLRVDHHLTTIFRVFLAGTFVSLMHLLHAAEKLQRIEDVDRVLKVTIEAMRQRRLWMVKTDGEYATIYNALLEYFVAGLAGDTVDEIA